MFSKTMARIQETYAHLLNIPATGDTWILSGNNGKS